MENKCIKGLETPCIVIDVKKAEENCRKMQAAADEAGCRLRPHIKTHKMPCFARMQMEYGAAGITCAKVSEAEVMADQGIEDIFIAYPMIGEFRIRRALDLAERIKRLILAVDSMEGAFMLEEAAAVRNMILEVRLEIDTGARRTGILRDRSAELAAAISRLPHLRLTGIYTFKSLIYQDKPTLDCEQAAEEEGSLMEGLGKAVREAGVKLEDISAGSTPTGIGVARTGKVNEIRPGTYIFQDYMMMKEKAGTLEEIAARYHVTVVSTPSEGYAVIDGGSKTFPMDILLNVPPFYYPGYAIVEGREDLLLNRLNEEHGILVSKSGQTGLKVGDRLTLIPIHICTAINMMNEVYLWDGNKVTREKVGARGMLV